MTAPAILFSAVTAGAAGAVSVVCLLLWRVRGRTPVLGWFALLAAANALFAGMHALRNGTGDLAVMDVALRGNSAIAPVYAIAILMLFRALGGTPVVWFDRALCVALAVIAACGLASPGGSYLDHIDHLTRVDLGWIGEVSFPVGPPDGMQVLVTLLYLATIGRISALSFMQRDRPYPLVFSQAVMLALVVPVVHGFGLARGWWGGVPLGEYAMATVFVMLCVELARRERRLIAELGEREAKLSALVEHGLSFAGLLDPAGRVVLANNTALRAVAARSVDVVGRPFSETAWWAHSSADRQRLQAAIGKAAAGEADRFLTTHHLADGRVAAVDFSITPFRDASGQLRYLIVEGRDVSELRRYEERLREGGKFEAIGQLAGGIAHDFNNALGGIMGAAELAMMDADPQTQRRLGIILSATGKAADLTRKLLSFARRGKVQDVPIAVNDLIEETLMLVGRAAGPSLAMVRRLEAAPDRVSGDPSELQAAILNLCLNARDAMEAGGTLTVATRVEELGPAACARLSQVVEPGTFVAVEIADTGCGMPPEVQARIFEPFFTTKPQGKGTGLGMPAVLGTVLAHRGALRVASQVGVGTTVTIWLPSTARPVAAPAAQSAPRGGGEGLVVVVEDEPILREQSMEMLRDMGFAVEGFADPLRARERLRILAGVRCVILDLAMPRLDGRTLYRELRDRSPTLPMVISSGYAGGGQLLDGAADGNLRFLPKPWRERQLRTVLEELGVMAVPAA